MTGIIWTDNKNKQKVQDLFNKIKENYQERKIPIDEDYSLIERINYIKFINGDSWKIINVNSINSFRGYKCEISCIDTDLHLLDFSFIPMIQNATIGKYQTFTYF